MKMLHVVQMKDGNRVFTFSDSEMIGFEANDRVFVVAWNMPAREATEIELKEIARAFAKWYNEE